MIVTACVMFSKKHQGVECQCTCTPEVDLLIIKLSSQYQKRQTDQLRRHIKLTLSILS